MRKKINWNNITKILAIFFVCLFLIVMASFVGEYLMYNQQVAKAEKKVRILADQHDWIFETDTTFSISTDGLKDTVTWEKFCRRYGEYQLKGASLRSYLLAHPRITFPRRKCKLLAFH